MCCKLLIELAGLDLGGVLLELVVDFVCGRVLVSFRWLFVLDCDCLFWLLYVKLRLNVVACWILVLLAVLTGCFWCL